MAKKWASLLEIFAQVHSILTAENSVQNSDFKQNPHDLVRLLVHKIVQVGQGLVSVSATESCVFSLNKNLLEAKIPQNNFTLTDHFEKLLLKLEKSKPDEIWENLEQKVENQPSFSSLSLKTAANFPNNQILKIQTNLSPKDWQTLTELTSLNQLFDWWQMEKKLAIEFLEIEPEIDNLAKISMNWKLEERENKKLKTLTELETAKFPPREATVLSDEGDFSAESLRQIPQFLASVNLELFLTTRQEICQETSGHVGILCGQNSTLNDCLAIIQKAGFSSQNYLILGESGSLTKITSKLSHRTGQLVILKNNDFLYLQGLRGKQKLVDKENYFAEIWFVGQPYLGLDKFWSPAFHPTLKQLYWQAQINQLAVQNPQTKIGVIRSYWK